MILKYFPKKNFNFVKLGFKDISLPKTELFFKKCIMLPLNMTLKDEEVEYIISKIKSFYNY